MRHLMKLFLALTVCLALLPASAYAKGGHGDHDRDDRDKHHDRDHDRDKHHDRDDDDRDDHGRPKGWDKGKKVGWGNCNEPPGQAKKHGGCNNNVRHDRDHDRDRDDRDRHNTQTTTHTWHGSTTASTTTTTTTHNTSTTKPVTTTKPPTTTHKVYRGQTTSTKTYKTNHE